MQANTNHSATQRERARTAIAAALTNPMAWMVAVIAVAVIGAVQQLDLADHSDEWAKAAELDAVLIERAAAARAERAAQAMCTSDHGPQVLARRLDDIRFECVNARGRRLSSSQVEVSHAAR